MAGKKGACRREGAAFRESSIPPLFEGFAVHDLVHLVPRVPFEHGWVAQEFPNHVRESKATHLVANAAFQVCACGSGR